VLTERNTRERLFRTYAWLIETYRTAQSRYGSDWQVRLLEELTNTGDAEMEDLTLWLIGLTRKTADNLDVSPEDYTSFLKETLRYCRELFTRIQRQEWFDEAWLLLMAGSATLNIRGSQKARIGKQLEHLFLKTALTLLGFELNRNFWMNIERDQEVGREADAEVESKRGRVRLEVGLIARGNQEVIEDKISRVGRNGVVICDRLGARSNVYASADRSGVKLIQIRHNQPLIELKRYLEPLVAIALHDPPSTVNEISMALSALPDEFFTLIGARETDNEPES